MRPKLKARQSRPVQITIGTMMLAVPTSALALSTVPPQAVPTDIQSTPSDPGPLEVAVTPKRIAYGGRVTVTGHVSPADAGQTMMLQLAASRHGGWRVVDTRRIRHDGGFRLIVALRHSGFLRVLDATASVAVRPTAGAVAPSDSQPVAVASQLRLANRSLNVLGGHAVDVRGRLLPGVAGRRVRLQVRSGRGSRTLASARTGRRGGFDLRYAPSATGQERLQVRFSGDPANTGSSRGAGTLSVFSQTVASWYEDGGSTACGFHANFRGAIRGLPCGTKVTFRYGGRSVIAVVDDRGPFVGGRDWDFNQNTAATLGFNGVGTVWSTK